MPDFPDTVALRHPAHPGEIFITGREAMPAHQAAGWVEAKSPEAKAAVAAMTTPEDPTPITGDEK